jgi:hypothetical protein
VVMGPPSIAIVVMVTVIPVVPTAATIPMASVS